MTVAPDTITGTITLTTGSAAFTTAGVNMLTRAHKPGDTIKRFGLDLVIATITDENAGTLTELCPDLPAGISGNATPVRIRFQPDGARVTAQARNLIDAVGDMVTRFKPADIANPSEIVLYEATANGVHKLTLRPPAALTADRVFEFPDVDYTNITDLFGRWTRASAAGPASLVFLEDTDEGANKVTLRAAAALGADIEFVMDSNGADLLMRWTRATAAGPASLDFHEDTDDGVHRMRMTVPALTADRQFLLPDADVTMHAFAAQFLNDADAPSVRDTLAAAGVVRTQTYTSSGTYTPHAKMLYCIIECVGGGGGGGGTGASPSLHWGSGGGGGSGGYSALVASSATIGVSKAVTIGAAGAGGALGNNTGGAGGDTSVGSLCIAKGGSGGGGNAGSSSAAANSGAGAVAGTGDIALPGTRGTGGVMGGGASFGGGGGDSVYGGGAVAAVFYALASFSGNVATAPGGGGGGGASGNTAGAAAGGAGAAGYVRITEICSA